MTNSIHLVTNSVSCMPCRIFKPVWEGVSKKTPTIEFVEHDIMGDGLEWAQYYGVMKTPTVLVLNEAGDVEEEIFSRDPIPFHTAVRKAVGLD